MWAEFMGVHRELLVCFITRHTGDGELRYNVVRVERDKTLGKRGLSLC